MVSIKTNNNLKGVVCCLIVILAITSCRKNYSKEGFVLPEVLESRAVSSSCSPCPFYIQVVELKRDTYFMVIPKPPDDGIICDWMAGYVIYDTNSILIDIDSDLYSRILSKGKRKHIAFDCH